MNKSNDDLNFLLLIRSGQLNKFSLDILDWYLFVHGLADCEGPTSTITSTSDTINAILRADKVTLKIKNQSLDIVMGTGQKIFNRVGSGHPHLWIGFGKSSLKPSNFSIFFLRFKKNLFGSRQKEPGSKAGQHCGSKVCSGWVKAHHVVNTKGYLPETRSHLWENINVLPQSQHFQFPTCHLEDVGFQQPFATRFVGDVYVDDCETHMGQILFKSWCNIGNQMNLMLFPKEKLTW